jgi:hypothetical protein
VPREPDGSGNRFGLLLLFLIVTYVISAFLASTWVSAFQIVMFLVVAGLAARTGRIRRQALRVSVVVLSGGSVAAVVLALTHSTDAWAGAASLWTAAILVFAVIQIVRRVLADEVITLQSIFGAVSAYMIIGLMFAAIYGAMNRFGGGGFFAGGNVANVKTFQYFSFTTLTTLGYGDFTAAGSGGQSVAVIEALFGQVFLATLVARLVAAFRPRARAAGSRREPHAGRGPHAEGPRRRLPGRQRAPRPRRQPGSAAGARVTRISSRGHGRPGRR